MIQDFILWTQAFVKAYGILGTFIIAFLESFVFPVPTATIIAPVTALGMDPFPIMIVATIGSVLGAFVGYGLGMYFGRPLAERLFKKHLPKVELWFEKYGAWAVFIAAFSPIPFKVFTWGAGITRLKKRHFTLASVVGRTLQFAIAAYAGSLIGPWILPLFGV